MKIRSGFVSNSSSSSFVIIATEETITQAKAKLSKFGKAVVDDIAQKFEKVTLDGKSFQMAHGSYSTEEFASGACEKFSKGEDEEYWQLAEKALEEWYGFEKTVKELGGISRETGC